ncbi:MAG: NAD(P)-dependent alcohol dehydrogenase [Chloroflexi bacterium]|nr:NAD(P)-dependent alcohol dehydrogenase [Chloroflexota bacterium]
MKAIVFENYPRSNRLRLREVEKPTPAEDQVLVRVIAASVNAGDAHRIKAPLPLRFLLSRLMGPRNSQLGTDIAGRVEAVGSGVTEFKPGDEVFGVCPGAFAEFVCAKETKLAHKPANVSFEAAAASPVVGFTALQGLRDRGNVRAGQKLLVNGATSGVGMFAVQYAKSVGAEVTGVSSTRNLELVRSMGADHVVDYTRQDFTREGKYDLIYDAIGNRSAGALQRALAPRGLCVVAGFTSFPRMLANIVQARLLRGDRKVVNQSIAQSLKADLLVIRDLLEQGKVVPLIERSYPLSETVDAIRLVGTRRARGKLVITMN